MIELKRLSVSEAVRLLIVRLFSSAFTRVSSEIKYETSTVIRIKETVTIIEMIVISWAPIENLIDAAFELVFTTVFKTAFTGCFTGSVAFSVEIFTVFLRPFELFSFELI